MRQPQKNTSGVGATTTAYTGNANRRITNKAHMKEEIGSDGAEPNENKHRKGQFPAGRTADAHAVGWSDFRDADQWLLKFLGQEQPICSTMRSEMFINPS